VPRTPNDFVCLYHMFFLRTHRLSTQTINACAPLSPPPGMTDRRRATTSTPGSSSLTGWLTMWDTPCAMWRVSGHIVLCCLQ
jgi:hypothetical protein